jgi:amino acid adenylation domain-containing protein
MPHDAHPESKAQALGPRPRHTYVHFTTADTSQSIVARFEQQVALHGGRIALSAEDGAFRYDELDAEANRMAHDILSRRGPSPEGVALFCEQGATNVAATLGVLKAGKHYVPLDPGDPPERLRYVLADAGAWLVLAEEKHRAAAEALVGEARVVTVRVRAGERGHHASPGLAISPDATAYIFYTSGSTGQPKGVFDTHRNVLHNVLRYTNNLHISCEDRLTLLQAPSFSGAVSSQFAALLNGGRCCPLRARDKSPEELGDWVAREGITIYHSVPALFRSFLRGERRFPSVRLIRLEGDQSSRADVALFRKHFGDHCLLVNGLGATETGISAQYFMSKETPLPEAWVPIGHPTEDVRIALLSDEGHEVPPGEVGEIVVKSRYLAPGYWRKPELSAKAFSEVGGGERAYRTGDMGKLDPEGRLLHLGRKDFRMKIRGFTVEPGEVEAALLKVPGVRQAVVTAKDDGLGDKELVAFVVPEAQPGPTVSALRRELGKALPEYMIPSAYVVLDDMPMSQNGKVDRRSLRAPDTRARNLDGDYIAPQGERERQLAKLWSEVLRVEAVGVKDDFFELGGTSLTAVRLAARIQEVLGRSVPPTTLFSAPTVEKLSRVLGSEGASSYASLVPVQPNGRKPPFYVVHLAFGHVFYYRDLAERLGQDQPVYGFQALGVDGRHPRHTRVEDMAEHYIAEMRRFQPEGPYRIGGASFGGLVAYEIAVRLRRAGQEVGLVALFDTWAPGALTSRPGIKWYERATFELYRRIEHHVGSVRMLEPEARGPYLREKGGKAALEIYETLWEKYPRFFNLIGRPIPPELAKTWQTIRECSDSYEPPRYGGKVTVFRADKRDLSVLFDPTLGWDRYAASVDVIESPGYHGAIIAEPRVRFLAPKLAELLARRPTAPRVRRDQNALEATK